MPVYKASPLPLTSFTRLLIVTAALAGRPAFAGEPSAVEAPAGPTFSQRINDVFEPVVGHMERVLFWDPFAAVGLYDPVLRDEAGQALLGADGKPRRTRVPFVVVWLIVAAVYFSIRMRFINFRGFKHAIVLVMGKYNNPNSQGEVTHFQALATALSATVGLGNIAGVAVAISVGGPGATFWLITAGILGMATKFVECTLGVKYRDIDDKGQVSGGPMYYLSKGLALRKLGGLGRALGGVYAFFMIFGSLGGGNMFQANQTFALAKLMVPALDGYGAYFGLGLAALVAVVIMGGIKGIAKVTAKIVPLMAVLYVSTALFIIFSNIGAIGDAVTLIVGGAFSPPALKGGFLGVMVLGFQRAAFSNEAGVGTASIAHSAAKTDEPVSEGIVALHEPFVDTVVICTMTALVLVFTGYHEGSDLQGAQLTSAAFGSVFSWFPYILMAAIFLFAFSTLVSFSYYGLKCFDYLVGDLFERLFGSRVVAEHTYRVVFLSCIVIGSASSLDAVMAFSDMIVLCLAFPNTIGLYIMASEVKLDLDSYMRRVRSGQIARVA